MSWKSRFADHLGRAATRIRQQDGGELHQVFGCLCLWLPVVITVSICNNSVYLQVCILISSPTNQLFSEPPTDYQWRQRSECWEMGLSRLKQSNFVIFTCISTKLSGKVYILLFNSCLKFHAKMYAHSWNINKSRRGLPFCVHSVCNGRTELALNASRQRHSAMIYVLFSRRQRLRH